MNTYHCLACAADVGATPAITIEWCDQEYALCPTCNGKTWEELDAATMLRIVSTMPGPDAWRPTIDRWYAAQPKPVPHESPPIENGPSLLCNACGFIRIDIFKGPFCKACAAHIDAAIGDEPDDASEAVAS